MHTDSRRAMNCPTAATTASATHGSRSTRASLTEPLLTCQQAAQLLAVKPGWIYAAARRPQPQVLSLSG
jgi:hypothetical protein